MYAILLNNAHINFERTGEKNTRELQRMKDIEIEMHKRLEKIKNLNSDSCYDFSDYSDSSSKDVSITSFPKSETTFESKKTASKSSPDIRSINTNKIISKTKKDFKIYQLKNIIKYLDIIVCLLASMGTILSQFENENFYNTNLNDRVGVVKLCQALKGNDYDVSRVDVFSFNISTINHTSIQNISFRKCSDIPIVMNISKTGKVLRLIILSLTLTCVPLLVLSNYFDFIREYIFKQNLDVIFFKAVNFPYLLFEIVILIPFPYPGVTNYLLFTELGNYICYPVSSMLSALTFLRIFFVFKLFKHITKWTSTLSEHICEKNVCKADMKFAFKAFQKENPFFMLLCTFVFSCVCFGLSIRTFERYYWEVRETKSQDWDYLWNCMWYIFVSMTTAGYGDFYTSTQVGRVIAIIACLVGAYFVAMMMVFMTNISTLEEKEKKCYGIINRLRIRRQMREIHANMVFSSLKMKQHKNRIEALQGKPSTPKNEKEIMKNDLEYALKKRNINNFINKLKELVKEIDSFGGVPIKETLFDISERIDSQISEVKREIFELQTVNEIVLNYTNDLMNVSRLLKKSLYATKLLYGIINKKKIFGKLNKVDPKLADTFDMQIDKAEFESEDDEVEYDIFERMSPREFKKKFDFILTKKKREVKSVNSCKSINYLRACTQGTMKKDKRYMKIKHQTMRKIKRITSKKVNKGMGHLSVNNINSVNH